MPIPVYTARCKYNCGCERLYIPLTLAFGKTIHSFQGQNVGPTQPGQPKNMIQSIVVDPGTRSFEAALSGLFYSVLSRVITLCDPNDITTSAIFKWWQYDYQQDKKILYHDKMEHVTLKLFFVISG